MAEMASVSATLHGLSETSPPSVPRCCTTTFTQVGAPGVQGGTMEVAQLRFSWSRIHVLDDVSRSVVSALESRFLTYARQKDRAASVAGGRSSTGSSQAGGSRPPAAPSARRGSAATPPTPPRRTKRLAPADLLPSPSTKSIRSLRSQKLQTRLVQAHEAAVVAMLDEDNRATVVTPHYVVAQVDPHLLWPDGGVVVYAQFPFLLDDSWRTPGLCLSYCRKVLCDPDPRSLGGTYEVIFTMEAADVDPGTSNVDAAPQGAGASPSTTDGPAPSPASTTPTAGPSAGAESVPSTPPALNALLTSGRERPNLPASASTDPVLSLDGSAVEDYERLDEEDLEELPLGMAVGVTPTSAGLVTPTARSSPADASTARTDAAAGGGDGGATGSPSRVSPALSAAPVPDSAPPPSRAGGLSAPTPPGALRAVGAAATPTSALDVVAALPTSVLGAPTAPPASASGAAAALVVSGSGGATAPPLSGSGAAAAQLGSPADAPAAAPTRTLVATPAPPVSSSSGAAAPPGSSAGAPVAASTPATPASAAVPPQMDQQDGGNARGARGRPRRQRESSPDAARGPVPRTPVAAKMAPQGLHDHYLKVLNASNADIGLNSDEKITIRKLAWSPKPTFAMRCAFVCAMDLETTGAGTSTTLSDQFFVAAYRARPGLAPVPMRVCD